MLSQVANTLGTTGSISEELVSLDCILKLLRNMIIFSPLGNPLCSNIPNRLRFLGNSRFSGSSSDGSEWWSHVNHPGRRVGCDFLCTASFYYQPEKKIIQLRHANFLTQTEGFGAVTERYNFEKIFFSPDLWHLCFTWPQNAAGGRAAEGRVWSPVQHRRLGSHSCARRKQQLTVAAAPSSA